MKNQNLKVYITDYITDPYIEEKILGKRNILKQKKNDANILLVWHQMCDKKYLSQFKNLKAIVRYGVGIDNIDLNYCKLKKIKVANTPDYGIDEVSDTALSMILYFSRSIGLYDANKKKNFGRWQFDINNNIQRSNETNVGILGFGRIGKRLSKKLISLGFNCFYYDPNIYLKIKKIKKINSLNNFIKKSDIISINCTLNDSSKNLIDKNFLNKMKSNSILINTARGKILKNLSDLNNHLIKNKNFCCGLDVLPEEPPSLKSRLIKNWKKGIFDGRLIINPHTAYYSTK
jgi:C-terminal binding protein